MTKYDFRMMIDEPSNSRGYFLIFFLSLKLAHAWSNEKLSIIYIPPNKRTSERQLSDHSVRFLKQIWLIMIFLYFISFSNNVKPMRPNPTVSEVSPTIFAHLFVLMNVITLIITTATFMLLTLTFTLLQARASSGWFSKHDCSNEDQCKGQYNGSCPHGSLGKSRPFCNKI